MMKTFLVGNLLCMMIMFSGGLVFGAGIESLEKECAAGNVESCGNLAKSELEAGNHDNAKDHAQKACDGGAMRGCTVLGLLLKTQDQSEAKRLFKKACDSKYTRGCFNLGLLEYDGGNKEEAKKVFKDACGSGDSLSCDRQGIIEKESGNKETAKALFKKSCTAGDTVGCSDLAVSEYNEGNKAEAERLWEKACDGGDQTACKNLENILNEKARLYEHACESGDMTGCYNYGLVREKRKDDKPFVLEVYQKACNGGENRACDAIKQFLTRSCIQDRLKEDQECYIDGPTSQTSAGVSITPRVRLQTESCNKKAKQLEQGLGCSQVGDFEAKRGNIEEAEKIFRDGCNKQTNSGCGGLVCIGYIKMNQGKESEAKRLFKTACDFSSSKPGSYEGAAYEGCTAIPKPPIGHFNKQNYSKMVQQAIKEMPDKESQCRSKWQSAWGPKH